MRTKNLIGKKIRGFYYRPNKKRYYKHTKAMEVNIGKVGVIHQVGMCGKVVFIRFKDFPWDLAYPLRLAKKHIIKL